MINKTPVTGSSRDGRPFIGCCASRSHANRLRWSDMSSDPISAIFVEEIRCRSPISSTRDPFQSTESPNLTIRDPKSSTFLVISTTLCLFREIPHHI
jgi:hypothetical protein